MAKKLPRLLRADIERGFIWAYYELVKGCQVTLDMRGENIIPVVALAHKPGEVYGMDFSSLYHFAEKEKPSTRYRWVKRKVEELIHYAQVYEQQKGIKYRVLYEIWCFIPPNKLVIDTVGRAIAEGMPVRLVDLEEVYERIKQVALLEPLDQDIIYENAFLWAAKLFREAGAWKFKP